MAYKTQPIQLQHIYLDNTNPRHDPIDNEPELIAYLIAHEQVKPLARDIAKLGTSPLDRFAVTPHPVSKSSYVVLEGNRRLCALKLLHDPQKASKDTHRAFFRDLASKMLSPPTSIEAVVFSDRDEARPWLARRHEGAQDGIGTRPWNPRQKARFNRAGGKPTNPNTQATLLLEYALARKLITKHEHDQINITTLTRFLSNPVFRNAIGLDSSRTLLIHVPPNEFDTAVTRFLEDARQGGRSGVHSRTTKTQREAYAHKLRKQGVAPTTRLSASHELDPSTGKPKGGSISAGKPVATPRNNRSPDKRQTVIPSDFVAHISDKILKRIYDELRSLDANEFSFAAAYLLRAMLERTVKLFCKKTAIEHGADTELHVLIGKVADKLRAESIPDRQIKPLRVMASDKHSRLSPETLGAYVHGGLIPTNVVLNRFWDEIEGNLKLMIERLK